MGTVLVLSIKTMFTVSRLSALETGNCDGTQKDRICLWKGTQWVAAVATQASPSSNGNAYEAHSLKKKGPQDWKCRWEP